MEYDIPQVTVVKSFGFKVVNEKKGSFKKKIIKPKILKNLYSNILLHFFNFSTFSENLKSITNDESINITFKIS